MLIPVHYLRCKAAVRLPRLITGMKDPNPLLGAIKRQQWSARVLICLAFSALLGALVVTLLLSPLTSSARDVRPTTYRADAKPGIVNFGEQPLGQPLLLAVEIGTGGEIAKVRADLRDLIGGRYYDPIADALEDTCESTPLQRVYEIDGEEAYFYEVGSRDEYNKYRTTCTHRIVRGSASATDKWQVELPHVGNKLGPFTIWTTITNRFGHQTMASIALTIVDDCAAPQMSVSAGLPINSPVARPGSEVTIEAQITDDLTGVFSARLGEEGARSIFGENPGLDLTRQENSNLWMVENAIPGNTPPGTYPVEVVATDRAGNETAGSASIEVAESISSFNIHLVQGWNLISVPKALADPSVEAVFAGAPVESVQTVVEGDRLEVTEIQPGHGYLVKASEDATITVDFARNRPWDIPMTMSLGPGWTLIGYASQSLEPAMPLTYYLGDDLKDEWMIVYADTGAQARTRSTSPYVWATDSFPTITGEPYSEDSDENLPAVELGKGYWIYLTGKGVLVP